MIIYDIFFAEDFYSLSFENQVERFYILLLSITLQIFVHLNTNQYENVVLSTFAFIVSLIEIDLFKELDFLVS